MTIFEQELFFSSVNEEVHSKVNLDYDIVDFEVY